MSKKPKYKVVERPCAEFGAKCRVYVIAKLTWLGFYWDTDDYFHTEDGAELCCKVLNDGYERRRLT
ncbi:MAG: hypothetical protein ACOC22_01125 [bacterium]